MQGKQIMNFKQKKTKCTDVFTMFKGKKKHDQARRVYLAKERENKHIHK